MIARKRKLRLALIAAMVLFALSIFPVSGAELTVEDIVNNANRVAYYQGKDGRADVKMTITDSQGRERRKLFTILRSDVLPKGAQGDEYTEDQMFYIYFTRPADINKMAFMVHKHTAKDDDRWLYLPSLDLVKRIAPTDKRTSFAGSHFFYEDVSGRNVNADAHELIDTTDEHYILKNTPKDEKTVEFAYFKMWIDKASFVVKKTEYYDRKGDKYRIYTADKVEKIDGYHTPVKSSIEDLRSKGRTVIEYSNVKYNIGIPDKIFTERYLRRAPRKYLK